MKEIKSVLIVNRGEIAIRISKTLVEMGIKALGVYSDDDISSAHLEYMDSIFPLNDSGPNAYLNINAIINIIKNNEIDAVHPGYGFLSESEDFAFQCEKHGSKFIGPNSKVLQLFADKVKAKELAKKLNIPVCDTSNAIGSVKDIEHFLKLKKRSSLMLKSNFGGGGRGSRFLSSNDNAQEVLTLVQKEAKAFSGSSKIFAEEFIEDARHIEVQVLGDGKNFIHFFERDCSFQRNFQKIIEMTPAPNLSQGTREKLYGYALRICEEVFYTGLATVEFLVDKKENIYFIEVNPRIQVEHTITEELTGVDLVRAQVSIFNGYTIDKLNLKKDYTLNKRASIQARINMEDYDNTYNLLPSVGSISNYDITSGLGIRFDGCGKIGLKNSGRYDSLLVKVIATSEFGLEDAIRKLIFSLERSSIEGVATNKNFLLQLLRGENIPDGKFYTSYIDKNLKNILAKVKIERDKENNQVRQEAIFENEDEGLKSNIFDPSVINSKIIGTIIEINIEIGDKVVEGQTILVQESMKMHHSLKADFSGTIENIFVVKGETVSIGSKLFQAIKNDKSKIKNNNSSKSISSSKIRKDLNELFVRRSYNMDKNRKEAVKKRKKIGKQTARENIKRLTEDNDFFEYGDLVFAAQRSRRTISDLIENTPADGLITGISYVNSEVFDSSVSKTAIMHYDYMVLAGTQGMNNHQKLDRMIGVTRNLEIPLVFFCEGGGGRPGDVDAGDQNIAGLNIPSFHDFARLSGMVPLVGIGSGRLFAGNAALLGCCDVIIATSDLNLGMGGPAMIEGGGLGLFKPEEVGPSSVQYPNGVIDILVDDEIQAVEAAKKYLSYFQGDLKNWKPPQFKNLRNIIPENRLEVYDVHDVINLLADIGTVQEIKGGFAKGIFTGFIRVKGKPLGVIANNPLYLAGAIDSNCADKAARFMQLCDNFDIPILSLCDTPGMMVGPDVEKTALVRHCSRMFLVGANVSVPMMTVILRKAYGLGAQAMAGGSFMAPNFVAGWPTAEIGAMGLEGAVKLGYRKELEAVSDEKKKQELFNKLVEDLYKKGKSINAASVLEFDTVIDPAETRGWISIILEGRKKPEFVKPKRKYIDAW